MWDKVVRIAGVGVSLSILLLAAGLVAGDDDDGSGEVVLFYTGETRGVLEPCGCTSGQLGGVVRRDAFLERARAEHPAALVLDHGGLVREPGRQPSIKFGVALAAMHRMDYGVVNVGRGDLLLGVDRLVEAAGESGIAFVSANLRVADRGAPFPAYAVVRAGGVPVAVLGAISPSYGRAIGAGSYLSIEEPEEALGPALEAAGREAKVLVLLYYGPLDEAERIARAHPALAVVLYGAEEEEPPGEPLVAGRTLLASCGAMGRYVGRISIALDAAGAPAEVRHDVVPMDAEAGESERMKSLLADYQERLRLERVLAERPRGRHPRGAYVGSDNCKDCHEREYEIWSGSKHSHAYEVLEREGHAWDPECAVCHSTGFAYETGFLAPDSTPELRHVGCEACHGPGEEHAVRGGEVPMGPVGEETCRTCHNATQTPHFDFETFFGKIEH